MGRIHKGILAIGLLSLLFITSCDPDGTSSLPESFDRSGEVVEITVTWHKNQQAVDQAYIEEFGSGDICKTRINRVGFAVWANPSREPKWCRIHAIKPTRVKNDKKMETLGHEFLHCMIGTFHPEPD